MFARSTRTRGVVATVASLALLGGGAAITATPAASVPPTDECASAFPVDQVVPGMAVDGLTVTQGTEPESFDGEVLGVVRNGIAPGVDMVMAQLSSAEIDRVGIWQGMSGSPVYTEDGSLVGAVAYGLSVGPSPVAGITPYEKMDDYLAGAVAPTRVAVGDRAARAIAEAADVSARQAAQGFAQLPMPVSLSGLTRARLQKVRRHGPDYLDLRGAVAAGGAAAGAAAGPESLVDGGNLGAALSYGDITAGGVGTITDVCAGRLVGFGHPMAHLGRTTLGLMPAEAVYVQGDPTVAGFKVATMGLPAGTIDQDRLTGISGDVGPLPARTDISSTITYGTRQRTGESHSLVESFNADVTFSQVLSNHDVVVDAIQPGTEDADFLVTGTDAREQPFSIRFGDRYTSDFDISFEGSFEVANVVFVLSQMAGVTVDAVTATSEVTDETALWRLTRLQQHRAGRWRTLDRRRPAVVGAGRTLRVRATLAAGQRTRTLHLSVPVPRTARRATLEVAGGASLFTEDVFGADTPAEVARSLARSPRNDEVVASLRVLKRRQSSVVQRTSAPQDLGVRGSRNAAVLVRR